jgi:hypothetical protein
VDYWKKTKPEFKQAMDKGKMIADAKVSHSLYLAAIGYSHPDTVILTNRVKKFNEKGKVIKEWTEPLIVPTTKCYPPNVQAAIKWLSARQPAVWGNKIEVKGKFSVQHNLDLSQFNNEELETLVKFGIVEDVNYEQ